MKQLISFFAFAMAGVFSVAAAPVPVGGGFTDGGLRGEYFANAEFTGKPAFTRKDVRIAFDWGDALPVGGSTAEPYRSFPRENFSVQWTGQILPRFSEKYLFKFESDSAAKLFIKCGDKWESLSSAALKAGEKYDIKLEYAHKTGAAKIALRWSSPSTPEEVIDPVAESGLNLASWANYCWADKAKESRWWRVDGKEPAADLFDENGWPKGDGEYILSEGHKSLNGTWLIQFSGKAEVGVHLFSAVFIADGKTFTNKLPRGIGYDAQKNLTTTKLVVSIPEGGAWLKFNQTSRDGSDTTGTGLTNIRLMRPIATGSDTPHAPDEIGYRPIKKLIECFTCIRWLGIANVKHSGKWADRTLPGFMHFTKHGRKDQEFGENWEYLVMMANETGRDLYLCTPITADNEYFEKLARLLKFGSDGREPYSAPQKNSAYPPLNPNLRVYLEVGNEIWNWAFGSTAQCRDFADREIKEQTAEAKIFNYDGKGNYRTWHALRTVRCSETFRRVFGDAAMGARVRLLCEYQYANAQDTAFQSLRFLDAYFNNGDGDHVKEPHPANYFTWGGGGAAYYGVGNPDGEQNEIAFRDASFEEPVIADGSTQSSVANGAWQFKGDAGLFRNLTSAVADYPPGKSVNQKKGTAVGFKFKTGAQPIFVYRVGRVFTRGSEGAKVSIIRESDKQVVMQAITAQAGGWLTKMFGYYLSPEEKTPVKLDPNTTYYVLSAEKAGESQMTDDDTTAKAGGGITILNAARAIMADAEKPASWKIEDTKAGKIFGPVSFFYSTRPDVKTEFPQPPDGQQAAFLRAGGEFSQQVNFAKAGDYALVFNGTGDGKGWPGYAPFDILVDDQKASPREQSDYRIADENGHAAMGGWGRQNGFKEEWGSAVFHIAKPGAHTVRFIGAGKDTTRFTVFDNIRIASADAIMESGFGAGSALGQPAENKWADMQRKDSQFALAFGLPRVSYETGWSLGGDFYQKPIHNWTKFKDPRGEKINDTAIDIFAKSGGDLPVWGVYIYWPPDNFTDGRDFPIMKSIIAASQRLPAEPDNGIAVPAVLSVTNAMQWHWGAVNAKLPARGDWLSWIVICPATAAYTFNVTVAGTGEFMLEADGQSLGKSAAASPSSFKAHFTKGAHGIRIRNAGGSFEVKEIRAEPGM